MKPSRVVLAVTITACTAAVLWWLLGSGTEEIPKAKIAKTPLIVTSPSPKNAKIPEIGTAEYHKFALEHGQKWLESRHRDAAGLVAMWDLTGEESLLKEAAKNFPDNPRVCVAMIHHLLGKGTEAAPWVDRLLTVEPKNPASWYWKAQLQAKSKNVAATLEALKTAIGTKGPPDNHLKERMLTVREAALASGFSVKEAAQAMWAGPLQRNALLPAVGGGIGRVLHEELDAAKKAGDTERVAEVAALGAASAEHLALIQAPMLMDDLVRVTFLKSMLGELEPETEFGDQGKTVAGRQSEIAAEREELIAWLKGSEQTMPGFSKMTDSQASEYMDRIILHGEWAAKRWLVSEVATGAKPE